MTIGSTPEKSVNVHILTPNLGSLRVLAARTGSPDMTQITPFSRAINVSGRPHPSDKVCLAHRAEAALGHTNLCRRWNRNLLRPYRQTLAAASSVQKARNVSLRKTDSPAAREVEQPAPGTKAEVSRPSPPHPAAQDKDEDPTRTSEIGARTATKVITQKAQAIGVISTLVEWYASSAQIGSQPSGCPYGSYTCAGGMHQSIP